MKNNLALILILLDILILIFWDFDKMIIDIFVICFPSTRNNIRLTSSDVIIEWKDMNWENSWFICKIIFESLTFYCATAVFAHRLIFAYFLEPEMVSILFYLYKTLLCFTFYSYDCSWYWILRLCLCITYIYLFIILVSWYFDSFPLKLYELLINTFVSVNTFPICSFPSYFWHAV